MAIKKVGVLGCGLMGSGIAQVAAQAGYDTVVREVEQKFLDKGLAGIDKSLGKAVEKGKLKAEDKDACISRLKGTVSLDDLIDGPTAPPPLLGEHTQAVLAERLGLTPLEVELLFAQAIV